MEMAAVLFGTRACDRLRHRPEFTEKLHFFVAEYQHDMRVGSGGGNPDEGEDIEVLELPIDEALAMIGDRRIVDAKTIMLLQYAALNIFR